MLNPLSPLNNSFIAPYPANVEKRLSAVLPIPKTEGLVFVFIVGLIFGFVETLFRFFISVAIIKSNII